MDGGYLADLKTAWIALSGTDDDKQIAVHALDPPSGRQLWTRGLEQGLCATEPVSAGLVCAEAIATDPRRASARGGGSWCSTSSRDGCCAAPN